MGGTFEDYKVTNSVAIQFDLAQRLKELAALGTSTANACAGNRSLEKVPGLPSGSGVGFSVDLVAGNASLIGAMPS
ncbi:MAG: hypothetical protein WBY44_15060 [Bryobacteraceae bacterium]|jgi:hypothetical protein